MIEDEELGSLGLGSALLDGELVVEDATGVSSFALLQADLKAGRTDRLVYYVFDLLYLDGHDLTRVPNFYIDISDYLDMKLAAFRCHASQMRPEPHHASVENVERLARLRGSEVSVTAAEAFECHRFLI